MQKKIVLPWLIMVVGEQFDWAQLKSRSVATRIVECSPECLDIYTHPTLSIISSKFAHMLAEPSLFSVPLIRLQLTAPTAV